MWRKCWNCSVALVTLFATWSVQAEEVSSPKLEIVSSLYDFGSVPEGQKVIHDFVLKNSGTSDLKIDNVVPACGCTASAVDNPVIAPGGEGRVHVEFDTTGFKGEKSKTVRLYTNDPNAPTSTLTLNGSVEVDVNIEPARLFFGDVVSGESPSKDVTVTSTRAKISKIETNSPFLKIERKEQGEKKQSFALSLSPDTRSGELRSRVTVTLDEVPPRVINIPVFASVKGVLQLKPSLVSFGVIEGTEVLERSVRFLNNGKSPVKIKEVKSSDDAVQAEVVAVDSGTAYVIHVRVNPSKVENTLRAVLDIVTDSPEEEIISLNVIGTLPAKL